MRTAFVHEAVLLMDLHGDDRAPGAAVTRSVCGSWDHEGACPLAPHFTSVKRDSDRLKVRVLFAVEPALEKTVRQLIVAALAAGRLSRRDAGSVDWRLLSQQRGEVTVEEGSHAARLVGGD
jgi:hypothetical protein